MVVLLGAEMKNEHMTKKSILLIGFLSIIFESEAAGFMDFFNTVDLKNNFQESFKKLSSSDNWERIDLNSLSGLSEGNINQILRDGKVPDRIIAFSKSELAMKETDENKIINKIRSSSTSEAEKSILMDNFFRESKPAEWNLATVRKLGSQTLSNLPVDVVAAVKDKEATMQMIQEFSNQGKSENDKRKKRDFVETVAYLINNLAENATKWNASEANQFPKNLLTPEIINKIPFKVAEEINQTLAEEARKRNDCKFGRAVIKKLIRGQKNIGNYIGFAMFFENLGRDLQKFVFAEDLSFDVANVDLVRKLVLENLRQCMKQGVIPPRARREFRRLYSKEITPALLSSEGPCAVGLMTLDSLNSSLTYVNQGLLKQVDECIDGADKDAKRRSMVVHYEKAQPITGTVAYSNLPDSVIPFGTRFGNVGESEARNILTKNSIQLTDQKMETLFSKINSGGAANIRLSDDAKAYIHLTMVNSMNGNDRKTLAKSMAGNSLPCVVAAMNAFGQQATISLPVLLQNTDILRCMSTMDAKKIDKDTSVFVIMEKLSKERISPSFAKYLRDRMTNFTMGKMDYNGAIKKLSRSDLERMPVAVLATFGYDLASLSNRKQRFLLKKMGKMESLSELPIASKKIIIELGLKNAERGDGLIKGDLKLVGEGYLFLPPYMIQNADDTTKRLFLDRVNTDIKEGKKNILCINMPMRHAIASAIGDIYGNPENLESMDGIECLMWAPSWNYINRIAKDVLDDASCDLPEVTFSIRESSEGNCLEEGYEYIYEMYMQLKTTRIKSLLAEMRKPGRKTGTQSTPLVLTSCQKTSILSMKHRDDSAFKSMSAEDIYYCLPYLREMKMDKYQARLISNKVLEKRNNDPGQVTDVDIVDMGNSFKGFNADEINKMRQEFFQPGSPVVRSIGAIELDDREENAVATRVKKNINSLSPLNNDLITSLGFILCGFPKEDLEQISYKSIQNSKAMFSRLNCNNVNEALPLLVDRVAGNPAALDEAKARDLGPLMAKMPKEYFAKIPPRAFSGITPTAMKKMRYDKINEMNPKGLENLDYFAANAISSNAIPSISELNQDAIEKAQDDGLAFASRNTASILFIILSICVNIFL